MLSLIFTVKFVAKFYLYRLRFKDNFNVKNTYNNFQDQCKRHMC
jgi:hypothetical protein